MDWGGHVHPILFRIDFLIRLNSRKKYVGKGSFLFLRDRYFPLVYNSMIIRTSHEILFLRTLEYTCEGNFIVSCKRAFSEVL